jgi:exonuclease III
MFRFATWNVRTLRTLTSLTLVADDLKKHKILVAGLQECRWLKEANAHKEGEYKFWGGGAWKNDAQAAQGGVAIAVHKSLWKSVERFILVSGRTAVMTLMSQMGKRIVFCTAWCPVEEDTEIVKEIFW